MNKIKLEDLIKFEKCFNCNKNCIFQHCKCEYYLFISGQHIIYMYLKKYMIQINKIDNGDDYIVVIFGIGEPDIYITINKQSSLQDIEDKIETYLVFK